MSVVINYHTNVEQIGEICLMFKVFFVNLHQILQAEAIWSGKSLPLLSFFAHFLFNDYPHISLPL